jgi:nicotinate-nucleotide pyrophosphorylase (carboxylating)
MARRGERVPPALAGLVRRSLVEDRVRRDRTTRAVVPGRVPARGTVTAQSAGVLSGTVAARAVAAECGLAVRSALADGTRLRPGTVVLVVTGDARRILSAERTLLNFLMHASGVATAADRAVRAVRRARRPPAILATRKTLPGLRDLEKAAVAHGGGRPHRRDLAGGFLVKNNHLAIVPIEEAVRRARRAARGSAPVEVEVRTREDALRAARAGAEALLIDNASPARARRVVRALEHAGLRRGRWVELSGGIAPETVGRWASVGADAVSLGALTHSAAALPFHLTLEPTRLSRRGG